MAQTMNQLRKQIKALEAILKVETEQARYERERSARLINARDTAQSEVKFLQRIVMNLTDRGSPIRQTVATVNYSGAARVEKASTDSSNDRGYVNVNQERNP